MPLGVREVLLVVRAQNMGSSVLRNLAGDFNNLEGASKKAAAQQMQTGSSLMAVGVAIGAVGAAGLVFLGKATSAAVEYNKQVALTKTQMFGVKATFDQVSEAGLATARAIAVPLDQIQSGLYDIFSSMDVNLTQAKFLLNNFSKEAVAGQVDLSVAERATIGIMNAYRMKVQDVTKVQDIMFNLVKFGVGTYGDFAGAIGRVTGPAVRQNQTFEQTAALMAFVTRNGLSASNAASTVGRALDALGKSRSKVEGLGATVEDALGVQTAHKLGFTHDQMIKVTDAAGKMLPINQIMTNLGSALKDLNPTQLNDVLTTMFKGTGGTIQAMRFFDIAIHNFGQLNTMVGNMGRSKGALKAAYDIMSNTPAAKIQLLKNNFQAFMIVLGQQFLPIVGKVAGALAVFFKFMGTLPKPLITIIAIVMAVVSVMLLLTGIVFVAIGAWLVFSAILAATEIALLPIAITIGLVIAAVAALAVAAYLIYKYWDPISKWFHDMWFDIWHWIDHVLQVIGKTLSDAWNSVTGVTVDAWNKVYGAIKGAWDKIAGVFSGITGWISSNFDGWWKTHGESVKKVWSTMWGGIVDTTKAYWNMTTAIFRVAVNVLKQIWAGVVDLTKSAWDIISGVFKVAWAIISTIFKVGMDYLKFATQTGWDIIVGIFRIAWAVITAAFKIWWAVVKAVVKIGFAGITSVVKTAWDVIVAIFSVFLDIITGHWHTALVDIQNLGKQIWNNIKGFLIASWNAIKAAAGPIFNALKQLVVSVWHSVYDTTQSVWHNILSFLRNVWSDIKAGARTTVSGLSSIWHGIENVFKVPVNFVIGTVYDNGIRRLWNDVMGAIGLKRFNLPNIPMMAAGGKLAGFGGGDRIPILAEAGETIVDKNRSRKWAWVFSMMGVPGYASGGQIPPAVARFGQSVNPTGPALGPLQGIFHLAGAAGKMLVAAATGNSTAFSNALIGALGIKSGAGSHLAAMAATLPVAMAKKIVGGLWHKITDSASGAGVNYKAGAGVQQWRGLVLRALGMEGLSPSLVGAVLYQMQTESGGNPRAINLTDINAQHGDPSRGLMQTIMSTFLAYHWPGTSFDIYNPLANIAAALNYAAHGRGFGSGVGQLGSGHGYARGTGGARQGWAWVGEEGKELVYFHGGETVVPHGGYAKGTKKIPQSEINSGLSIFAAYIQNGLLSLAKIQSEHTVFLKAIARYYSGGALHWRQAAIQRQTKAMENASKQLTSLQSRAKAASTYAASVTANLSGYAALSGISLPGATSTASGAIRPTGAPAAATTIQGQLHQRLTQLKKFATVLGQLRRSGLSVALIRQIVDMGPDDGFAYAQAILATGRSGILDINKTQAAITATAGSVGKAAAAAVYGQAAVDGFKAQQKQLQNIMRMLGKELGVEAAKWLHVPKGKLPKGYATGTNWASPGSHWVGENGPELVTFRGGERVTPAGRGQTIIIYTNEIDPRRHAAELGWELARRSS